MPFPVNANSAAQVVERVNPLLDPNWDAMLASRPGATFFHGTPWLRVLFETYGFQPVFFTSCKSGKLPALLPMMEVDSWLTGRRGAGLPFTDECAPLCSDPAEYALLYASALAHARQRRWKYMECRGGRSLMGDVPASTSFYSHGLELGAGETQLFANMEASVRRAVRKAEQSGLTVTMSQELSDLRTFYTLLGHTRKRHGLPAQPYSFFSNIHRHVLAHNKGQVILVWHGSIPVAGAVFVHFGNTVIYKFGASDERLQHLRANNLVMWEAIKWHARRGFSHLDFGRTSISNIGLRKFKLGWGTIEGKIEYVRQDIRSGAFISVRDEAAGWYNRIFRILPVSASRLAGALLYKHAA